MFVVFHFCRKSYVKILIL